MDAQRHRADRAHASTCARAPSSRPAGAIGTPALLLRSGVPDPHGILGKRTFLHPTVVSAALMPERVDGFAGAPQTIYSDHFLETQPIDGPIGYKLEAPPLHPVLTAITLPDDGVAHAQWMQRLPRMQVLIALLRDGFHPDSQGGTVRLRDDGTPVLDYPLTPLVWDGVRRALRRHGGDPVRRRRADASCRCTRDGAAFTSFADARAAIDAFDLQPLVTPVVSAHVMGGAPIGPDPARAVVDVDRPPSPARAICTCSTARCFRRRSAPIRSCRSTASSRASRPGSRRRSRRALRATARMRRRRLV